MKESQQLSLIRQAQELSKKMQRCAADDDWQGVEEHEQTRHLLLEQAQQVEASVEDATAIREAIMAIKAIDAEIQPLAEQQQTSAQKDILKSQQNNKAINQYQSTTQQR